MTKLLLTIVVAALIMGNSPMMMAWAGGGHGGHGGGDNENLPCDLITTNEKIILGAPSLYMTDGQPGLEVIAYVKYREHRNHIHVCEMGVRMVDPKRVSHCLPNGTCPRGEAVNLDFIMPGKTKKGPIRFKSVGFNINVQGHAGGNYEEFRNFWNECEAAGDCPADPSTSYSYPISHVDLHFFFKSAADVDAIDWPGATGGFPDEPGDPPPAEIADKCDCEPKRRFLQKMVDLVNFETVVRWPGPI